MSVSTFLRAFNKQWDTTVTEQKKHYIATYGSLRKEGYNYIAYEKFYGVDSIKYIETLKVKGFKLYGLGTYPGAVIGDCNDELTIDILEISEKVHERIFNMEVDAGYEPLELEMENYPEIIIYIYTGMVFNVTRVVSGDWIQHQQMIKDKTEKLLLVDNNVD